MRPKQLTWLLLFVLVFTRVYSQPTPDLKNKLEILKGSIKVVQKGKVSVNSIDTKTLKGGWYYAKNGEKTLFIEVRNGDVAGIYLSDKSGKAMEQVSTKMGTNQFICGRHVCACAGDADCDDMFTTNVCGQGGWCVNHVCFC